MKKTFETPAIEIFRMQVSEDLTVSSGDDGEFEDIPVNGVTMFRARASVEDWFK